MADAPETALREAELEDVLQISSKSTQSILEVFRTSSWFFHANTAAPHLQIEGKRVRVNRTTWERRKNIQLILLSYI